jgi:hypothetical protein
VCVCVWMTEWVNGCVGVCSVDEQSYKMRRLSHPKPLLNTLLTCLLLLLSTMMRPDETSYFLNTSNSSELPSIFYSIQESNQDIPLQTTKLSHSMNMQTSLRSLQNSHVIRTPSPRLEKTMV